jgi:methionyl aminopeptidase
MPFPKSICTSVNHVVCHGIPSLGKKLKNGDAINIDITVIKDGYHGDTSKMFFAGEPSIMAKRLSKITQECMYKGIEQVRPGARLGDIGYAIQRHAESNHFSVVREFCGHGIAKVFHDDPQVLHYGRPGTGVVLDARSMDGGNQGPQAIGPVGAHTYGNRRRLRNFYPAGRRKFWRLARYHLGKA